MQRRGGHPHSREHHHAPATLRLLATFALALVFGLDAGRAADKGPDTGEMFDFGKYDESQADKWKEVESALPPYPEDRNLIAVPVPGGYTLKVYVDEKSVSRLTDGVARFTLVVESSSGARNVFFEGYNCATREYKTYAIGTPDGTFEPIKLPRWERPPYYEVNAFRFLLLHDYVCDPDFTVSALRPRDFVRRLKETSYE